MGYIARFNETLEKYNFLENPASTITHYLDSHPTAYKIVLIVNHLFRAAMMVGLMFIPGVPKWPMVGVCFAGSLFYRLTVERNCAYKFAMPAFAGAMAFMLAIPALIQLFKGTAFLSVSSGFLNSLSIAALPLYGAYIVLTVSYDVDKRLGLL